MSPMADAYVYFFTALDRSSGKIVRSTRLATLAAIKTRGKPIMDTQTTVDESELDAAGFLVGRSVGGSVLGDDMRGEIRSLNLRATSRDREAMELDEGTDGAPKYLLRVESRELRKQAGQMQQQRRDILATESNQADAAIDQPGVCPDAG
ncbi:MAG: hypothetical protein WA642_04555 [Steroidobacteraceae bacterium]